MENIIKKIYDYSLEEIMGERFGAYSKYIIQDRAIPDVRDGLKPVQRRILYSMFKEKNTSDKPFRKSAKTVGNVMGNYHPHGDSSIYDAMVRLSQYWKMREQLVEMHGNNGSIDGDSPAAMRYTEARLSTISKEMLKGLDRDTVLMAPNFDDTELEPTVLPAKFPNLLVNGGSGISAGYATNIPPHNLKEVIEATIKRIDNPTCRLDTIMAIVKGPDFPTGGTVQGLDGIKQAYETGRGKVIIKSKIEIKKSKGKDQIIITEIPYEINKSVLVAKIDEIRIDKKIQGISEIRDESDRTGLKIAIDIKPEANSELILKYLLKNTDLQIAYNFNIVAIVNRRPKTLGLLEILDAYIKHQEDVTTRRTKFDLDHAKRRMHIVEGLIKAVSILDSVIKTIRKSKNKQDAKENLIKEFDFTEIQSEAIVTLQLYKLTNTDITELEEEAANLKNIILKLNAILENRDVLMSVIKHELKEIKNEYQSDRRTIIEDEIEDIKLDETKMIPKEDVIVVLSKDGYIKRVSPRSYEASDGETGLKDEDYVLNIFETNTKNTILVFTDKGNYLYIPVYEIQEQKWKDLGVHVSNIVKVTSDENIIGAVSVSSFNTENYITLFTKNGMVKRTIVSDFEISRYSKAITAIKLKENDLVTNIETNNDKNVFITTSNGYGLWYSAEEIPLAGVKAAGVKAINLKNDFVTNGMLFSETAEYISVFTDKGAIKRIKLSEFTKTSRAKKGVQIIREIKSNPHKVIKSLIEDIKTTICIKTENEIIKTKISSVPIADRYSSGSSITKDNVLNVFVEKDLKKTDSTIEKELDLKEIDNKILTIDDFLNKAN